MAQEVREDYLESLEELTGNSRPIIKTLTEISQEVVDEAPAVADAIETHTLHCPPAHKLPALYLIDSICKNVGEPYRTLFTPSILELFTNAFSVSPEPVRLKMGELFKTWTMPDAQTGEPVFPHEILRQINDFLVRQQMAAGPPAPFQPEPQQRQMQPPFPHGPPGHGLPPPRPRLTQSVLLVEMNRYRQLLEQDAEDQFNERQVSLLHRLEAKLSGVVDPKDLVQILQDLDNMKIDREQYLSRPPSRDRRGRGDRSASGSGGGGGRNRRDGRRDRDRGRGDGNGDRTPSGGVSKITGSNNVPLGTRKKTGSAPVDIGVLAEDLNRATAPQMQAAAADLDLATACSTDAPLALVNQLYGDGLPLQCSTCGYRFHDTAEGRAAKEAEMDWHFRANKDMREGHSRNRTWFLGVVSWVAYRDEDEVFGLGSDDAASLAGPGGKDASAADGGGSAHAVDWELERSKYIPAPADSNAVCPVCQEPHATSWSEEAENWVWMNAIEVEGHYFHATCFADPQNRQIVASVLGHQP